MRRSLKIASGFIAVIIGAGFASGQEILLYFTSFGYLGTLGAIVSTILLAYLGMMIVRMGSQMQATSYHEVITKISGRRLGMIIDVILVFTLFSVGVVMIAGAGTIVEQQYTIQPFIGSLFMSVIVIITLMLKVDKIISIIGSVVPVLAIAIIIVFIYNIFTMKMTFFELHHFAVSHQTVLPNWFIASLNYISSNLAASTGMALLIGGAEKDKRVASFGGFLGGLGIGILIIIAHLTIFSRLDAVLTVDMPLLLLMNEISGLFGMVMGFILLAMIFSTAVSMFYAFIARFFEIQTRQAVIPIIITVFIAYFASFAGFTNLVAWFYPIIGYLGFLLMAILMITPFRLK